MAKLSENVMDYCRKHAEYLENMISPEIANEYRTIVKESKLLFTEGIPSDTQYEHVAGIGTIIEELGTSDARHFDDVVAANPPHDVPFIHALRIAYLGGREIGDAFVKESNNHLLPYMIEYTGSGDMLSAVARTFVKDANTGTAYIKGICKARRAFPTEWNPCLISKFIDESKEAFNQSTDAGNELIEKYVAQFKDSLKVLKSAPMIGRCGLPKGLHKLTDEEMKEFYPYIA